MKDLAHKSFLFLLLSVLTIKALNADTGRHSEPGLSAAEIIAQLNE